jgi:chemotaxis protein methyltransferase CheR
LSIGAPNRASKIAPPLGYGDCLRFGRLVYDHCGLDFSEQRRPELERGVRQAFAASTCAGLDEYYHLLRDPDNGAMHLEQLVNALTVCETHFFRNAAQFDALYSQVLPQIIERRRALRTLRIWSAGCASGAEPYSIAILLQELLPDVDEWSITILGTDINTEALDRARKATYNDWAFREQRARQWRSRYFHKKGDRYELVPEVRHMVTFAQLNLAKDNYPAYETNTMFMDLILCRNVTIYFTESVTQQAIERLYDALVGGGWLVVGHSEHSLTTYHRFQARNYAKAILYQRTDRPSFLPKDWKQPTTLVEKNRAVPASVPAPADVQPDIQPPAASPVSLPENGDSIERARELLNYGRSEQARDLLLEVVNRTPRHATACVLLGQAYANLSCWQDAERWCHQAVHLDKLALDAYYTLALVLQHQGKLDRAIEAMKKVVYIDRNHVLGHFGLANLYRSNGQVLQALKSLDNARRLLNGHSREEVVPSSGGITVGRLRATVIHQQQRWSVESAV